MFIYIIVNSVTGKYYIGQHKGSNLQKYLQDKLSHAKHKTKSGSVLFSSMRKHPKEVWSIHALLSSVQTREELDLYEREFINLLQSRDPRVGYNICKGGEGFTGVHTEATRKKIAVAAKNMWENPDVRNSIVGALTGRPVSDKTRALMRDKNTGHKVTEEAREHLRMAHKGHTRSKESRMKQGLSIRGGKHHGSKGVRCIDTDEVFASGVEAAEKIGCSKTTLYSAIKRGYKCGQWRYEYTSTALASCA